MMWEANKLHEENVQFVHGFCRNLIEQRRAHPTSKKDIFNALVSRRDPVTGEELALNIIIDNMITFLFAGESIRLPSRGTTASYKLTHHQATTQPLAYSPS